MNVRTIFRLRLARGHRLVHRLRTLDGVWRLRHIGFRRLFLHTAAVATYLPS